MPGAVDLLNSTQRNLHQESRKKRLPNFHTVGWNTRQPEFAQLVSHDLVSGGGEALEVLPWTFVELILAKVGMVEDLRSTVGI
jgi:hypothetical protein